MSNRKYFVGLKQDASSFYLVDAANDEPIPVTVEAGKLQGWKLAHYWSVQEDGSRKPVECSNPSCSVCR